jgi:competence protein ComEC
MNFKALIFLIVIWPVTLAHGVRGRPIFVVWNVGQGQWATLIESRVCHHFDSGGEINPAQRIRSICRNRRNFHSLSHLDQDHLSFLSDVARLSGFCRQGEPSIEDANAGQGRRKGGRQRRWQRYHRLPACASESAAATWTTAATGTQVSEITMPPKRESPDRPQAPGRRKSANDWSRVFTVTYHDQSQPNRSTRVVVPGDSPIKEERQWLHGLGAFAPGVRAAADFLILGHHGSRTSTGLDLLKSLPRLRGAIASARRARYGHPHREVELRLRKFRVPLLKIEDWNNIWIEL